jgi:hypothetical protein
VRTRTVVALTIASFLLVPNRSVAQDSTGTPRTTLPICNAAVCDVESAYIAVIDSLARHSEACRAGPPAVLRSIHIEPFTWMADAALGRRAPAPGVPSSPSVANVDDANPMPFRRYSADVRVLSARQVARGQLTDRSCLVVLSPIVWYSQDSIRVTAAEWRGSANHRAQRFVTLARIPGGWRVVKVETGAVS